MEVTIRFKSRTLAFLLRRWVRPAAPKQQPVAELSVATEITTTPLRRTTTAAPTPPPISGPLADSPSARRMPAPIAPEPPSSRLLTLRLNHPPEPIEEKPVVAMPAARSVPAAEPTVAPPAMAAVPLPPPPVVPAALPTQVRKLTRQNAPIPIEEHEPAAAEGWFSHTSPMAIWITGVLSAVLLVATAMVATMDTVPDPTATFGQLSGAMRQSMVRAEPELPRPPQAAFPFRADPAVSDSGPAPAPRILGLRNDGCLDQVPNPALDPWNAKLSEASARANGAGGRIVAPLSSASGCFPSPQ